MNASRTTTLQQLRALDTHLSALREAALARAFERLAPALEALSAALPAEVRGQKGRRLWDAFRELEGAVAQIARGRDHPDAPWFSVLLEGVTAACETFAQAIAQEERRLSDTALS